MRHQHRAFVKASFTTKLGSARANVRYISFRSRELDEEQRGAFDREHDHAQVDKFNDRLDDPMTRHPKVAKAHKLVFSLSEQQWHKAGFTSWKPIAREVMERFEQRTGKRLDWIGAEHMSKGHPHCHITMKSTYTDPAGQKHRLRLTGRDIAIFKEELQQVCDRTREFPRGVDKELQKEAQATKAPSLQKVAGDAARQVVQAFKQAQRHHEIERQRMVKQEFQRERQRERRT